jgi:hypothetical protein
MLLTNYVINFINLFAPHISPRLIVKAAESNEQSDVNKILEGIELPVKGGCDQIQT